MPLRSIVKRFIPQSVLNRARYLKDKLFANREIAVWEAAGRPVPPPRGAKYRVIEDLRARSGYRVFVETGTYYGDMVYAQRRAFSRIFSIELSEALYAKAVMRFRGEKHIKILQGDSGIMLNQVLRELDEPAIFWLDGHYSGGETALGAKQSPVNEELNTIISKNEHRHIVLIDDANCFTGSDGYPTVEQVRELVRGRFPDYSLTLDSNVIAIVPSAL